jgi:hypothetical protein
MLTILDDDRLLLVSQHALITSETHSIDTTIATNITAHTEHIHDLHRSGLKRRGIGGSSTAGAHDTGGTFKFLARKHFKCLKLHAHSD